MEFRLHLTTRPSRFSALGNKITPIHGFSNRKLKLLEIVVSYRKQKTDLISNRKNITMVDQRLSTPKCEPRPVTGEEKRREQANRLKRIAEENLKKLRSRQLPLDVITGKTCCQNLHIRNGT